MSFFLVEEEPRRENYALESITSRMYRRMLNVAFDVFSEFSVLVKAYKG